MVLAKNDYYELKLVNVTAMPDEKMSYSLTFEGLSEDDLSGEKELAIKGWQDEALGYMFEDNYTVSVSFNGELIAEAK